MKFWRKSSPAWTTQLQGPGGRTHLESLSIIALVAELEDAFDILIPTVEIVPENFNSVENLWEMVCRLQEEG